MTLKMYFFIVYIFICQIKKFNLRPIIVKGESNDTRISSEGLSMMRMFVNLQQVISTLKQLALINVKTLNGLAVITSLTLFHY